MNTTQSKAAKGTVGIESFRGKIRLRLPRSIETKNRYISTGWQDTPENSKKAQKIAWQIEDDISRGTFDSTLASYKPQHHLTVVQAIKSQPALSLSELWEQYTEYRKPLIAETTLKIQYAAVRNHIAKLPTKDSKRCCSDSRFSGR